MFMQHETYPAPLLELVAKANSAAGMIPPLFPLSSSVAVNPFLGQTGEPLAITAARLARVGGIPVTPPRADFAARVASGEITQADISDAIDAAPLSTALDVQEVLAALELSEPAPRALPTVADLAAQASGIDWPALIAERIGHWAASHFDEGQALWQPYRTGGAFLAWREFAARDLTPEIQGLGGFGAFVAATSRSPWRSIGRACETLGIDTEAADTAFHRVLTDLGGWAQYARYLKWQADLADGQDSTITDLLAIRLIWEEALLTQYETEIGDAWRETVLAHAQPITPARDQVIDAVLQEAAERAGQRKLAASLGTNTPRARGQRAPLQAAFCIDVRSEVFRRALESLDPGIETIGFAGFFGLPAAHHATASDVRELRGPVLINTSVTSRASTADDDDRALRFAARARRAWGRFKLAAVSSFAFVEAMGPVYVGKLIKDTFGLGHGAATPDAMPVFVGDPDLETRAGMAETVLRAMSLTGDFARVVLIAGHGASVTNNAHASALQCGACGGHSGEVNARLLAGLLGDADVRRALAARGIDIPDDTLFVAALHDTTTDQVTLFDCAAMKGDAALARARTWLEEAGALARGERAMKLPRAAGAAQVARRSTDWAELRPEWGLAGCSAFIAAPRGRTDGTDLAGRSFLHSYDWKADEGFGVLELIMTAPVVVASWISLQYYGSVVAPDAFGGGNKLLHNVTGGIGVVEGNGGALRAGLPWQSVHDGARFMHDPLRLSVVIEAPREAMNDILRKHPGVKDLFDNRWLHLLAMDENGELAWRYDGDLTWTAMAAGAVPTAIAAE